MGSGCASKTRRIFVHYLSKKDIDVDIDTLSELINRRNLPNAPEADLQQHRTSFSIVARFIANIILTSSMATPTAPEQFRVAFTKALASGRVDFSALIIARLAPPATTATNITEVTKPAPTLKSESDEYWRKLAEDATKQLHKERASRDADSFRPSKNAWKKGKNNRGRN